MKILIVDDELVSRMKMQKIMNSIGECEAVESGSAAVMSFSSALKNKAPFELITLDVSMPEMNGIEILNKYRAIEKEMKVPNEKQVKVMMVTSQADKETIITCVKAGCNDYITKPFDKAIIISKLQKMGINISEEVQDKGTVRETIMETVQRFKKGNIDLPVLPKVVQEIQNVMNKSVSTVDDIVKVIDKDAVISAKLIAIANSPLYRGTEKIYDVSAAIPRLGIKECQSIVSAIANKSLYKTKDELFKALMERIWLHSLACAYSAKAISNKLGKKDGEKLFLMGLIHDIGKVLLLKALDGTGSQGESLDKDDLMDSIQEVHTTFGAALLEQWGFTQEFIRIAKLHEWTKFDRETEKEVLIINMANNLARKIGYSFFDNDEVDLSALESAKLLEVAPDMLETIGEEVKEMVQDSAKSF
ncbi:HDOD domain-containing protein [Thermodesulfobacteriota bacterium]